jgi:hypothetical protein
MVPRTVLVPVTVMQTQVIQETETRTVQVPKTVMEDREIEVPRQVYETVTRTVQRPKTVMEEKVITVQEPKTITVPREVPVMAQPVQYYQPTYSMPTMSYGSYPISYQPSGSAQPRSQF